MRETHSDGSLAVAGADVLGERMVRVPVGEQREPLLGVAWASIEVDFCLLVKQTRHFRRFLTRMS